MDSLDTDLVALLRTDARRSVSELALELGVSRATVRARMAKLHATGEVLGYTAVLRDETRELPVRAIMSVAIEGKRTNRVSRQLATMPEVRTIHTTNGRWDLVLELATRDLPGFDAALGRIRLIEGVAQTKTSLLLQTLKRSAGTAAPPA